MSRFTHRLLILDSVFRYLVLPLSLNAELFQGHLRPMSSCLVYCVANKIELLSNRDGDEHRHSNADDDEEHI